LLPWASRLEQADRELHARLDRQVLEEVMEQVPESWIAKTRGEYVEYFLHRLDAAGEFVEEAMRARAQLV
jgi:hypothetical protein